MEVEFLETLGEAGERLEQAMKAADAQVVCWQTMPNRATSSWPGRPRASRSSARCWRPTGRSSFSTQPGPLTAPSGEGSQRLGVACCRAEFLLVGRPHLGSQNDFFHHIFRERQLGTVGLGHYVGTILPDDRALPSLSVVGDEDIGRWLCTPHEERASEHKEKHDPPPSSCFHHRSPSPDRTPTSPSHLWMVLSCAWKS
jgi:hypothetical protein